MNDLLTSLSSDHESIPNDLSQRLHSLTIDQLKHEEHLIDLSIAQAQHSFSDSQMRDDKRSKYARVCHVHLEVYGQDNKEGMVGTIERDHQEYMKRNAEF